MVVELLSEKSILRTGILVALLGTVALFFISSHLPPQQLSIVAQDHQGELVKVVGRVTNVRHVKNVTIITLEEEVTRSAVVFDSLNITKGARVEVQGDVKEYKGEPELVISRLVTKP